MTNVQKVNAAVDDLLALTAAMEIASDYGMEHECILWAMYAMKENNTLSVKEAFDISLGEWIK
jgi:hypothetical protein